MTEKKHPIVVDEQAGDKWICACGKSQNAPYCDGAHAKLNTGKAPVKVTIDSPKKVVWCGCGRSEKNPFCDGAHKKL